MHMSRVCILTDSTAQMPRPGFPGREHVFVAPFTLQTDPQGGLVQGSRRPPAPMLLSPSAEQFLALYQQLGREYDAILVLALSSRLHPLAGQARLASARFSNHARVEVLDTLNTAAGLGWLIEDAAALAAADGSADEIIRQLRLAIPRIFSLFFLPDLASLAAHGFLSPAQVLAAEMMGLLPVFIFEEGRLVPLAKAASQRAVLECFHEFFDEFESPRRIALTHTVAHSPAWVRALCEYVQDSYPQASFTEHALSLHQEALLGPRSVGLAVMQ